MKKYYLLFLIVVSLTRLIHAQYLYDNVVTGLTNPSVFTFLPNNNVIITQLQGLARIYTLNNTLVSTFWNFTDSTISNGERGLIGVCLDPNYSTNHYIYFYYIHNPNTYRVVRLTENNNLGTNPFIIFSETVTSFNTIHIGGNIHFGSDNKLYITIGNNGVDSNSQSLHTFKGKILRINSNGTIPTDNPFYDDGNPHTGNDDRIWAYGLRNSFDFCFSPYNDSLYATENSNGNPDEINFIRKGKNYGYPYCEGFCNPYNPLYKNPMTEIPGNGFGDYAPTGIMFYTGTVMPEFTGKLLVVGYGLGQIYKGLLKCDLGNAPFYDTIVTKTLINNWTGYTCLKQGTDGFIYAMNLVAGRLERLRPNPNYVNNESTPSGFSLEQNYPNPFNPKTSISYMLRVNSYAVLKIFDLLGKEVAVLVNQKQNAGNYKIEWDASDYSSGVYFYELQAGDFKERKKMVLIK